MSLYSNRTFLVDSTYPGLVPRKQRTPFSWLMMQSFIPDDVLVHIFNQCIMNDRLWGDVDFRSASTVQVLASVCRHWREVALSNPLLWASIVMLGVSKQSVAGLDVCLRRSQDVPLTIGLCLKPETAQKYLERDPRTGKPSVFECALGSMVAQQRRWLLFAMVCNVFVDAPDWKWILDDLPLLENLVFKAPIDRRYGQPTFHLDLSKAPRLTLLDLHGDIRLFSSTPCVLEHLTNLQLEHTHPPQCFPSVSDCLFLLSMAPNLERLHVYPSCSRLPSERNLPHLVLPKLHWMEVGSHGARSVIGALIAELTLPALKELRIVNDAVRMPWRDEMRVSRSTNYGIPELLARSRPPLRSFTMYSIVEHEPHLIATLQHMPGLKELTLSSCCTLSHRLLMALELHSQPGTINLCPVLERIYLRRCVFNRVKDESIMYDPRVIEAAAQMITSRWDIPEPTLKLVKTKYSHISLLQKDWRIVRCGAEGLGLEFEEDELEEDESDESESDESEE
ncbi:hypothetical protein DFH11DRAFT_561318 [Phellopilus nigrolimitatus]|nr:hypothetical protein DFH11DRAFT_561318 [Phellopilus nigrolimitatus]